MKKLLSLILMLSTLLSVFTATAADDEVTVTLDGSPIEFDARAFIENNVVLVPMRAIFEALGADVAWYDETWWGEQMASASKMTDKIDTTVNFEIGKNEMNKQICKLHGDAAEILSEETISLEVPAVIVDDYTFVPLRAVSEAFGAEVSWDAAARTVIIKTHTSTEQDMSGVSFTEQLTRYMPTDKNYMVSPVSIKMALAMAANGALGDTKSEILDALGIENLDEYNDYVQNFIARLNGFKKENEEIETENAKTEEENSGTAWRRTNQRRMPEVEIANSIWYNTEYYEKELGVKAPDAAFAPDFEKLIAEKYDGVSQKVNYGNAVNSVNDWVSEKTRGKIRSIIDDPAFLAALVNAVYMKAQWAEQFSKSETQKDVFTDRNGKEHEIDFMNNTCHMAYYSDDDITMARLPYYGGLSMTVVLGDNTRFEEKRGGMTEQLVHISMPKFKIENEFILNDILNNMGIKNAFDSNAGDFDAMLVNEPEGINTRERRNNIHGRVRVRRLIKNNIKKTPRTAVS